MQLNSDELIRISNLKVTFPLDEGTVQALDGIDLSIRKGKVIGVVGESGCGKSITARTDNADNFTFPNTEVYPI